ncbi:hypothetical protein [Kineococcus sp. R86509]|uniref:hypothetical protein n=1 Tax=Kineococcus sp. R86509 TaxID=3093851 RepID=UPI0036D237D7
MIHRSRQETSHFCDSVRGITGSAETTAAVVSGTRAATDDLHRMAGELSELVHRFRV